ncbi:MAG: hypothetical protein GY950_25960, partial [bacterium]|nr:hypothetical protein [bacterium]
MTEIIKINWILMAANGCWILGAAVIAARLSIMEFTRRSGKIEKFPRKLLLLSAGLIVLGAVLINFKIPTFKLLVPKITHLDETRLRSCDRDIVFPLNDLKMDIMNGRHKRNTTGIIDNSLALFFDGYIQAPMMKFGAGDYTVSFSAWGTKAMDEYAALKIEFERLENNYLIVREMKLISLIRF